MPKIRMYGKNLVIDLKYVVFHLQHPVDWFWDWGIEVPKVKNWFRLAIDTPVVTIIVPGWLFWGEKEDGTSR